MKTYDVAIIGIGTMGSAAALELRRRNASVVGFDQLAPPHSSGSHSGQTRIFRLAHYDTPLYVPLAQRAGRLWDALSAEVGTPLVNRIGLLKMGPENDGLLGGIARASAQFGLSVERLTAAEVRSRYPAFRIPDEFIGYLEPSAGWINVDAAIQGMQRKARELGAELFLNEPVESWKSDRGGVVVRTAEREIAAGRLIITAGAWATRMLRSLGLPIRILRKTFFWFDPLIPAHFSEGAIPVFGFPPNIFYGFPSIRGSEVKVAEHLGGQEIVRPEDLQATEPERAGVLDTVARYMPGLAGPLAAAANRITRTTHCLYAMTPDEHPVLDLYPESPNVVFGAGFSGHGFKFTPVIGEVMADLALSGATQLPIEFLRWNPQRYAGASASHLESGSVPKGAVS